MYNYSVSGSSMFQAANLFIDNLAIPFKPRAVILNEGSNDIHAGTTPDEILVHFRKLYRKLHSELPNTRLYVLSLVPDDKNIVAIRKTNTLLERECKSWWIKFIDVTEPLIGDNGKPKKELFKKGDIHMRPSGYAVWKSILAPVIVPAETTG